MTEVARLAGDLKNRLVMAPEIMPKLHCVVLNADVTEVREALLEVTNYSEANVPWYEDNSTPFIASCTQGVEEVFLELLGNPLVDPNKANDTNYGPLEYLTELGLERMVAHLIVSNKLVITDPQSVFTLAMQKGQLNIFEMLQKYTKDSAEGREHCRTRLASCDSLRRVVLLRSLRAGYLVARDDLPVEVGEFVRALEEITSDEDRTLVWESFFDEGSGPKCQGEWEDALKWVTDPTDVYFAGKLCC